MFKIIEGPVVRKATSELAKHFVQMASLPEDRPYREGIAILLEKALKAGQLRAPEWASVVVNGIQYRINGKHTSILLSKLKPKDIPKDLRVVITKFFAKDFEEAARIYATYDSNTSARTQKEINHMFAASCPELTKVNRRTIDTAVAAIGNVIWSKHERRYKTVHEKAALIIQHTEFLVWINKLFQGTTQGTRYMHRSPVNSVMFETYSKDKKAATEFWQGVRDGSSESNKTADRFLQRWLMTVWMHRSSITPKEIVDERKVWVCCVTSWNNWRRNIPMNSFKYYAKRDIPEAI
jgi:hypothetical protein